MRRIQQYTTASLLLMTLSAGAETWFSTKTNQDFFISSHELLKSLIPTAMENIEMLGNEYFPLFWSLTASTILQLPLWSIFALTSIYFSYLLMKDSSRMKRYGKDFENLEMWSRLAHEDSALYFDKLESHDKTLNDESIDNAPFRSEISSPDLLLNHDPGEAEDPATIIDNSIFEIISDDDEVNNQIGSRQELSKTCVDPDISRPIPASDSEIINRSDTKNAQKDEIDEFDEFCEFLNNMEENFMAENFYKTQSLEETKDKK